MAMSILQFPMMLLGGKLADTLNRKKIIIICDLVTVTAYIICGFLFENHLGIAFILTGLATLSSTILILLFVKQLSVEKKNVSTYEEKRENESVRHILKERKTLITTFMSRLMDVRKILIGETLIVLGLFSNRFVQGAMGLYFYWKIVDARGYDMAWLAVGIFGAITILLVEMLNVVDKRQFGLLYETTD